MRWPWSPAPFIPDEEPWEEPGLWGWLATLVLIALLAAAADYATLLTLDGLGDQLRLALHPEAVTSAQAHVTVSQSLPPRLSYAFRSPDGARHAHSAGVPPEVQRRLQPGDELDVVYLAIDPETSAPAGQAAIGSRLYNTAGWLWALYSAGLWLLVLLLTLLRRLGQAIVAGARKVQPTRKK